VKISDAVSSLTSTYCDWNDVFVNRSFIRRNNCIAWENFEPQRLPPIVRRSDVMGLENSRQYSFQVIDDGSIFQLYYEYEDEGKKLERANLAYYNSGISSENLNCSSSDQIVEDEEECEMDDQPEIFLIDENSIVSWLRIDYVPEDQNGPLHHGCHMHIGLFQVARIPLSGVPTPRQFIEFIMALCYPNSYRSKRLNPKDHWEPFDPRGLQEFNVNCFPKTEGSIFDILPYICIPTR